MSPRSWRFFRTVFMVGGVTPHRRARAAAEIPVLREVKKRRVSMGIPVRKQDSVARLGPDGDRLGAAGVRVLHVVSLVDDEHPRLRAVGRARAGSVRRGQGVQ
jgi:hypothetical protein